MQYIIGIMVAAMIAFLIGCIVLVVRACVRNISVASVPTRHFEKYKHHGKVYVWVRSDLKGEHRNHCLCFDCSRFHPGSEGNCPVAQRLFYFCVENDVVTPVWECPKFVQDPYAAERKYNFKVAAK